jgi:hypothetical protein
MLTIIPNKPIITIGENIAIAIGMNKAESMYPLYKDLMVSNSDVEVVVLIA